MDKTERFIESVKWSAGLHWIYFALLSLVLVFESFMVAAIIAIVSLCVSVYYLFFRKFKKEELFIGSWIILIVVIHIGVALGHVLEPVRVISIGATVSALDILSFTKKGRKTLNARAMANTNFASRLVLFAVSPKDRHLIPAKGLGDFLFYSIWISSCYMFTEFNWRYLLTGIFAIFIGSAVNWLIVSKIYLRENYKGFPATPIPFICILPVLIVALINFAA